MRFRYSSDVDILLVSLSEEPSYSGEDNEGVIVHHSMDGTPLSLEILDARLFVMFANASLVTGKEVTNPEAPDVPYPKERNLPVRAIPSGDADLRFKYQTDCDILTVMLGDGISYSSRRNHELTVYYDQNELPVRLEIERAREFVLGTMQAVLLYKEVTVA